MSDFGPPDWIAMATREGLRWHGRLQRHGIAIDRDDLIGEMILGLAIAKPDNARLAMRIVQRRRIDWLRANVADRRVTGFATQPVDLELTDAIVDITPDPGLEPDELTITADNVTHALRLLNLREHVFVVLRVHGYSQRDIAGWLGVDEAVVSRAIGIARLKLSQAIDAA